MTIFVGDLKNPEAPVLFPDGSICLVEMHPSRGWVLWLSADGKNRRLQQGVQSILDKNTLSMSPFFKQLIDYV